MPGHEPGLVRGLQVCGIRVRESIYNARIRAQYIISSLPEAQSPKVWIQSWLPHSAPRSNSSTSKLNSPLLSSLQSFGLTGCNGWGSALDSALGSSRLRMRKSLPLHPHLPGETDKAPAARTSGPVPAQPPEDTHLAFLSPLPACMFISRSLL